MERVVKPESWKMYELLITMSVDSVKKSASALNTRIWKDKASDEEVQKAKDKLSADIHNVITKLVLYEDLCNR